VDENMCKLLFEATILRITEDKQSLSDFKCSKKHQKTPVGTTVHLFSGLTWRVYSVCKDSGEVLLQI